VRQCVGVAASVSVLSVSVFFEVVFFTPGRLATLHKHAGEEDWEKKRRVHDNKIMYGYTLKLFFKGPTECIVAWNNLRKSTAWRQDHIENDLHNKYLLDCSIPTADSARKLNCKKTKHCCNSCHMHEAKRKIGEFFFQWMTVVYYVHMHMLFVCRERRKSAGTRHFYPIEDEGEDDIFTPAKAEQPQSSPATRASSRSQSSVTTREETKVCLE